MMLDACGIWQGMQDQGIGGYMLQGSHHHDDLHRYHGISNDMRQGLLVYIALLHPPLLMMMMPF